MHRVPTMRDPVLHVAKLNDLMIHFQLNHGD